MRKLTVFIFGILLLLQSDLSFAKLQETRWSPDTCGCVVVYEWDDEKAENQRTHAFKRAERVCSAHASGAADKFLTVLDENQRKNKAMKIVMDNFPELTENDAAGNPKFKQGMEPDFSFTAGRKLKIHPKGLSAAQKAHLNTVLDANLPVDKADAE